MLKAFQFALFILIFFGQSFAGKELKRTVLAIYDRDIVKKMTHQNYEMIFHYYGLKLEYHSSKAPYPKNLSHYRGILVVANSNLMEDPAPLYSFLNQALSQKIKIIIFGHLPGEVKGRSGLSTGKIFSEFYEKIGITIGKKKLNNPLLIESKHNKEMINFERDFEYKPHTFRQLEYKGEQEDIHLSVHYKIPPYIRSDLVITGDFGGIALNPAVISHHKETF
ncbi:MAG: hypothetical protein HQL32_15145, partial [Planctomycetes bacterium]|nr:hypothetical protein [Planctomycetota bacterium]